MVFIIVYPHFGKKVGGHNHVFNINPYFVAYHVKSLLTIKIMTLRRGFKQNPWPKWLPVKCDRLPNFDEVSFRMELTYTPLNCTIVFIKLTLLFEKKYHSQRSYDYNFRDPTLRKA